MDPLVLCWTLLLYEEFLRCKHQRVLLYKSHPQPVETGRIRLSEKRLHACSFTGLYTDCAVGIGRKLSGLVSVPDFCRVKDHL